MRGVVESYFFVSLVRIQLWRKSDSSVGRAKEAERLHSWRLFPHIEVADGVEMGYFAYGARVARSNRADLTMVVV